MSKEVRGIGVKDEVTFTWPANLGGKSEAEHFGEVGRIEQADIVVGEGGEEFTITGCSEAAQAQLGWQCAFFDPLWDAEDPILTSRFAD